MVSKKKKKSAKEIEVEELKTYNTEALKQRHHNLSINSETILPIKLVETSKSYPSEVRNFVCSCPNFWWFCSFFIQTTDPKEATLSGMEKNVSAAPISHSAKKKNGRMLSPYNSFHCRHMIIQSFVYSHLKNKPNPT